MAERALTKEEVKQVIEGRGHVSRVPFMYRFWIDPAVFGERADEVTAILNEYPEDIVNAGLRIPYVFNAPDDDPTYRWIQHDEPEQAKKRGMDAVVAIEDWDELNEILLHMPSADYKGMLPKKPETNGKYLVANSCCCLFERLWTLRGMENALTDFYTDPESVHRLFDAVTTFHCRVIERCAKGFMRTPFSPRTTSARRKRRFSRRKSSVSSSSPITNA